MQLVDYTARGLKMSTAIMCSNDKNNWNSSPKTCTLKSELFHTQKAYWEQDSGSKTTLLNTFPYKITSRDNNYFLYSTLFKQKLIKY